MARYTENDYLDMTKKENHEMFVPFDVVDAEKMGTAQKSFVRCKGVHLQDLYRIINGNKDSHYVTCANDFIKTSTLEEFKDIKISVVLKSAREDNNLYTGAEVASTQVAESLGINTPFIKYLNDDKKSIIMVDYLEKGDVMIPFNELIDAGEISKKNTIEVWLNRLRRAVNINCELSLIDENSLMLLMHDLIKAFLVRRFVMLDTDLNGGNLAIIHNANSAKYRLMSFDYEYCFNNSCGLFGRDIVNDEKFLTACISNILNYPFLDLKGVLGQVVEELSVGEEIQEELKSIMKNYPVDDAMKNFFAYRIFNNLNNLVYVCKKQIDQYKSDIEREK